MHLRNLCDQHNALLIFDEIQSGMGRTGKLFGYQWDDTEAQAQKESPEPLKATVPKLIPDIVTMAKALGGGLPIGAMLCTEKVAQCFKPGDHGTTFGGNPIVTAVARAAFMKINTPEMLSGVVRKGAIIRKHLESLNNELSLFENIRGRGMMIGAVLSKGWKNKSNNEAYLLNMELSQDRSRSVLSHIIKMVRHKIPKELLSWTRKRITANGLSSSNLYIKKGTYYPRRSRRVEFKVRTNSEERIELISTRGGVDTQ